MDSNNTASTKKTAELDIRDVASYLIGKLWIIALVVLCFAIIAFLWTTFFVTKEYKSTTDMFVISTVGQDPENTNESVANWNIAKQLTKTSSELIMGDYCDDVAEILNNYDPKNPVPEGKFDLETVLNASEDGSKKGIIPANTSFSERFGKLFPSTKGKITGDYIRSHISVSSDEETCIVSVTATTGDKELSAALSNAVMHLFGNYINDFLKNDEETKTNLVKTTVSKSGTVPSGPSNANATSNALIFGAIGAVLICAVLIIIFIFDDKIKTPDDVEKQLGLSVLGAIPEIDEM